jgi:hypothetical protein
MDPATGAPVPRPPKPSVFRRALGGIPFLRVVEDSAGGGPRFTGGRKLAGWSGRPKPKSVPKKLFPSDLTLSQQT